MQIRSWCAVIALVGATEASAQEELSCDNIEPAAEGSLTLMSECLGKLTSELSNLRSEIAAGDALVAIPSGAIAAFDHRTFGQQQCPVGWEPFTDLGGRVIVGAGDHTNRDEEGNQLSELTPGETGGVPEHMLSENETPAHSHEDTITVRDRFISRMSSQRDVTPHNGEFDLSAGIWSQYHKLGNNSGNHNYGLRAMSQTVTTDISVGGQVFGGNEAHQNMMPYIALMYCIKS